jgi:rhamnose utilization protein RhaD (predicted bifunctional aldolase and dehydrogenase)
MDSILTTLTELSRYLGNPARPYTILGEGNTSARIDSEYFYLKASGTTLGDITEDGFVKVHSPTVMAILEDETAGDDDVTEVFKKAVEPGESRRPSVEAMLHAILLSYPEHAFVGHTHPIHTNMVLCSKLAVEACEGRLFPDHIVSMGHKSVFVPYVDPGLPLAREVKKRLEQYIDAEGILPKAILMQNHGLIAMGDSPKSVTSCTDMCEKSMEILVGTYAMGGPNFMTPTDVERIFTRPDEHYRHRSIAGTVQQ